VRELPKSCSRCCDHSSGARPAIQAVDSVTDTVGAFDLAEALARLIQLRALIGFRLDLEGVSMSFDSVAKPLALLARALDPLQSAWRSLRAWYVSWQFLEIRMAQSVQLASDAGLV